MLGLVLGHDLQSWVQFFALLGIGWAGIRWIVRHYLKDMLAEQQTTAEQTVEIHEQVHANGGDTMADTVNDTSRRMRQLERDVAVLLDRSNRQQG
jgi:hypothetical protein